MGHLKQRHAEFFKVAIRGAYTLTEHCRSLLRLILALSAREEAGCYLQQRQQAEMEFIPTGGATVPEQLSLIPVRTQLLLPERILLK